VKSSKLRGDGTVTSAFMYHIRVPDTTDRAFSPAPLDRDVRGDLVSVSAISSMATKPLLTELCSAFEARTGQPVALASVGGVEVVRRVQAGEAFDVVALSRDAIEKLSATGHVAAGSAVDLAHSPVAVAVRAGARRPDIGDEDAVRRAVLAARTIGASTGPSGVALGRLFERWGIATEIHDRIVTPPPGIPVGAFVASGQVELGFQQLSELAHLEGIDVVGPLPPAIQIVTTFAAAVGAAARRPEAARTLIAFLGSPAAAEAKRRHGMDPADDAPGAGGGGR
jgi:molybdate transport system substrate-binding protein